MTITPFPNQTTINLTINTDEPLLMLISFDGEQAYIAPLDEAVEHHVLLNKLGLNHMDIDKYFRIILDSEGADWTFICPTNYKNITDKYRRIKAFYNDGFNVISEALTELGYFVGINIPKRYKRHMDELRG